MVSCVLSCVHCCEWFIHDRTCCKTYWMPARRMPTPCLPRWIRRRKIHPPLSSACSSPWSMTCFWFVIAFIWDALSIFHPAINETHHLPIDYVSLALSLSLPLSLSCMALVRRSVTPAFFLFFFKSLQVTSDAGSLIRFLHSWPPSPFALRLKHFVAFRALYSIHNCAVRAVKP